MTPLLFSGPELLALLAAPTLVLVGYAVGLYSYREQRRRQSERASLAAALERLRSREELVLDDTDVFNHRTIGLDRAAQKLAWIDHNTPAREWCIALEEVDTCSLITSKEKGATDISGIFLELQQRAANRTVRLHFYREGLDPVREKPSLFRKAKYWKSKIHLYKKEPHGTRLTGKRFPSHPEEQS